MYGLKRSLQRKLTALKRKIHGTRIPHSNEFEHHPLKSFIQTPLVKINKESLKESIILISRELRFCRSIARYVVEGDPRFSQTCV